MLSKIIIDNMKHIVDTCVGEDKPACVTRCPMHCDVKKYIKLIHEGRGEDAISVIRETLFTPGILGRICAHPCESACRREKEDKPLSIARLKRYAADNFDNPDNWNLTKKSATSKKVAVIGCGPAGAQAALTLIREGHSVTIYDKNTVMGGTMRTGIPEYRLPRHIIDHEFSLLTKLGVEFKLGVDIGKDISFDDISSQYDAVIVAVGRQIGRTDRSLNNFDAKGIHVALEFLRSVSNNRTCDNIGKVATVLGGGDVAMDCARSALRLPGVHKVHVVCLESSYDMMRASELEITEALEEGIIFHLSRGIREIITENNTIKGLKLHKCLSIMNEEGQFAPKFDAEDVLQIETDSLIFAVGQLVDTSFDTSKTLALKGNGTFEADPITLQTPKPNIFVAGDCASALIVIDAMAEGQKAAVSVDRYLRGIDLKEGRIQENETAYETKLFLPPEYLPEQWDLEEKRKRYHASVQDPSVRINNFNEVEQVYTKEQAMQESNRCLQCECKLCMKECLMLSKYTSCPKVLFTEYLEKGYENLEPKIAFSCNDCNQCTLRCPYDLNIQDNFIEMRKDYVNKRGGFSDFSGHIALDDGQELECSSKYSVNIVLKNKHKYAFIPGCTVPASLPEQVEKIVNHLSETLGDEVSSILRCCGRPTEMIGQMDVFHERYGRVQHDIESVGADTLITVCPSCYKTYDAYSGKKIISYWDLMKEQIGIPKGQKNVGINSDVVFNIHDPCVTRNMHSHHESIRWILDEMGYKYEELKFCKSNTRCCGVGGMLGCVDPDLQQQYHNRRTSDANQDHMVTYCGSCRGSMEKGGKDSVHILELLFRPAPYMKADAHKRGDNYGFHNRMDVKNRFIKLNEQLQKKE